MLECFGVIVGCVSFDICVLYVCDNVPKILENWIRLKGSFMKSLCYRIDQWFKMIVLIYVFAYWLYLHFFIMWIQLLDVALESKKNWHFIKNLSFSFLHFILDSHAFFNWYHSGPARKCSVRCIHKGLNSPYQVFGYSLLVCCCFSPCKFNFINKFYQKSDFKYPIIHFTMMLLIHALY